MQPRTAHPRPIELLAAMLAIVSIGACGLSDGDDEEPPDVQDTFSEQPPFDAFHADGTCGYRASDGLAASSEQSGHFWTYADGRAVRHTVGWGGSTRIVETWSYDTAGRLVGHERLAADGAPDDFVLDDARIETWSYDGEDHLIGWTLDELGDGRIEQTWTWTWDAQGRLVTREADLDPDAAIDYRETTNWLSATTEITEIDTDGNGTSEVRIERHFDDAGQVFESIRQGGLDAGADRRIERVDTDYVSIDHFDRDGAQLQSQQSVHYGLFDFSALSVAAWSLDDLCLYDRDTGERTGYGFNYDVQPPANETTYAESAVAPAPAVRWDARANVIAALDAFDFAYDGDFVGARCGGEPPHGPWFPWPVPVSARSLGIDMLCMPEHLACRHLDTSKVIRCPQM